MHPWHSPLIYGMHEPCPPDVMPAGWIVHLVEVGDNAEPHPGVDLSAYSAYGNIVRLQYSWGGGGTFPMSDKLGAYLERVRSCVSNSPSAHVWQVGNEPNHPNEWAFGFAFRAPYVAQVYDRARLAIHDVPGHELDEVLLPPVAPWVDLIGVGWIEYFKGLVALCDVIDGFALHTYSRGADMDSITAQDKMDPPYERYYNGWPTLYDWLDAIPEAYRDRPCYLTETNQIEPWSEINTAWVRELYRELNRHNQSGGQVVRCACLYRWPHYDRWGIEGNLAIISDFQAAQNAGYTWVDTEPPGGNDMLLNPSFEGAWYNQTPDGILVLPEHWRAEYREGDQPYKRPEIKPNEEFATDGRFSIRAFPPAHSRGFYGIWQEVEAVPGQWYRFSADCRAESNPPGGLGTMVGIQPWGGSIFHRQMIWGEEVVNSHDWRRLEVIAQAFGGKIRVAMGADNEYATTNNTTWWDNAKLELWECDGGTNPEPPGPGECNWNEDRIRQIVREELAARDPVAWPKL